jgi:hypothetical protein
MNLEGLARGLDIASEPTLLLLVLAGVVAAC